MICKIGIFGGTFNPIHNSHLFLAEYVLRTLHLNKVLFVPTFQVLYKKQDIEADFSSRMEMIHLAIKEKANFEISNIDYVLKKNSYTYYTLSALKEKYANSRLYFIIGEDSYQNFHYWYKWQTLLSLATFVVVGRGDQMIKENNALKESVLSKEKIIRLPVSAEDISSTMIRRKIILGESIKGLVPKEVEKYIYEKHLYQ